MTEKITLELTLDELKLIDKYVEFDYDTKSLVNKIKNAYPNPRMIVENQGNFDIISYDGRTFYRLQYPTDTLWFVREHTIHGMMLRYVKNCADGDKLLKVLEECWISDVYGEQK